jgi:hypothetical protein
MQNSTTRGASSVSTSNIRTVGRFTQLTTWSLKAPDTDHQLITNWARRHEEDSEAKTNIKPNNP